MRRIISQRFFITHLMSCVALTCSGGLTGGELSYRSNQDGTSVFEHGELVLTYRASEVSQNAKWPRTNYLHPVNNLSGQTITEDFPKDHPHHRGIFWAWHQLWLGDLQLGDAWACQDFRWDVHTSHTYPLKSGITIANAVTWKTRRGYDDAIKPNNQEQDQQDWIEVVDERNWIQIHTSTEHYRLIDIAIELIAKRESVRIGGSDDVKGYGGFSVRMALNGSEIFSSNHRTIEPTVEQLKADLWMNIHSATSGVAMMNHSENAGLKIQESSWIVRRKHSMQNAVFPGRHAIELSATEPLRLRYRLVIHDGTLSTEVINGISRDFDATQPPWENEVHAKLIQAR